MGYTFNRIPSNIEEQVDYLEKNCHLFAKSCSYLSKTEFGATMHNILLGIRRLEVAIRLVIEAQRCTLLDVVPFKPNNVLLSFGHIRTDISLIQPFDVDKRDEEDSTDWKAMIKLENKETPFTIGDDYEEYENARFFLMSNIRRNYYEAVDKIKQIENWLKELDEITIRIETKNDAQRELYNKMCNDYEKKEWSQDRLDFIEQENATIKYELKKGKEIPDILKSELRELKHTHLNSFMPAPVKRLYNTVLNQKRLPYEVMVRNRKKLSEDDISDYFSFLFRYQTLWEHIESIPLLAPLTGKYEKLFTCRAAKEYVDILSRALMMFGGIEGKEHFGILLIVMNDLGLALLANKPYLPMMHYANEINKKDESLRFTEKKDQQSSISKVGNKLGNTPFCELEYGDKGDSQFADNKIEEYQEVYSRCYAILNQRGLRMPKEIKVASYLKNPNLSINLSIVMDGYSKEQLYRLNFLRSVLRRETLVFG